MSDPATQLHSLAGIVGAANVNDDPQALLAYAIDGSLPAAAAWPSSAAEVAEIVKFCAAEKLAVVPAGATTKLHMAAPPREYDLALVTTRLDKIAAYDPGDLTLSVEAGARLSDLMALLASHRQLLPLAAPFLDQATIGGTVASGIDSPLRQLYGTARDFLLGIEFVTGDGIRAKSGGRVVKNVAGYDLHKLFIGSMGTLGVITQLNFKTFPVPEAEGAFFASFAAERGALDLLGKIRKSPLRLATLDVLDPALAELLAGGAAAGPKAVPGVELPRNAWVIAAGFGGSEAALVRYASELESMAGAAGALSSALLPEDARNQMGNRIREAIPALLDESPSATIVRVGVQPSRLGEIFAAARQCADRHGLPLAILARAVGAAYLALLPREANEETFGRLEQATGELADAAAEAEGFTFVGWRPAELIGRVAVWGKERSDLPLMRKVKESFDPKGTMSPGRFIGGL
jgi:glycolate oxidase FAD binding subunit